MDLPNIPLELPAEDWEKIANAKKPLIRPEAYQGVDYKKFIEDQFMVRPKEGTEEGGYIIPFKLNAVQNKYYDLMMQRPTKMEGVREIILKARQQGFSTFILALFAVDFITRPNSVSICISHRSKETKLLFKRVRFFIESYCTKNGFAMKDYLSVDSKEELENATNGAYFYIGTAGAKVGGRGDTVTNLHFSEAAFYNETEKIDAKEIIEPTTQQVPQEHGMIFIESTGGAYGSYFQREWERAKDKVSNFTPRFFSWKELYSDEWIEKKKKDFQSEEEFHSHYPIDDAEAFLFSGRPFFDRMMMKKLQDESILPLEQGMLSADGGWI